MEENKNRKILVCTVVILLISVIVIGIYLVLQNRGDDDKLKVTFKQIYLSEYELDFLGNDYFYGTINDNLVAIIDKNGKEVYHDNDGVFIDGYYRTKDGNYLFYGLIDNGLITYLFDGKSFYNLKNYNNVTSMKPLIYGNKDNEYVIGFIEQVNDVMTIYGLNDEVVSISDCFIVADKVIDGKYYIYNENYIPVKNSKGMMGIVSIDGTKVVDFKYLAIVNSFSNSFIALNSKKTYGVISSDNRVLLDFNYKAISYEEDCYVLVNKKNKMALYNEDFNEIIGFDMNYNAILDFNLFEDKSFKLMKYNDYYVLVNNVHSDRVQYYYNNLYVIKDGEILNDISQNSYGLDSIIYTFNDKVINIYNDDFEVIREIKIDDIELLYSVNKVSESVIKVRYFSNSQGECIKYINQDNEEVSFDGELLISNGKYYGYVRGNEKKKLVIVDASDNEARSIEGNSFKIKDNYLIVDNGIYEIVER